MVLKGDSVIYGPSICNPNVTYWTRSSFHTHIMHFLATLRLAYQITTSLEWNFNSSLTNDLLSCTM